MSYVSIVYSMYLSSACAGASFGFYRLYLGLCEILCEISLTMSCFFCNLENLLEVKRTYEKATNFNPSYISEIAKS